MNIIIIGAGDIGFHLAKRLSMEKHNISLIEQDLKKLQYAHENLDTNVIEGSGCSFSTLQRANIASADVFCAMTNNDEINLLACRMAKKSAVPLTIARVRNAEYYSNNFVLTAEELGVDFFIHPELETAKAIVRLIRQSSATDVIEFDQGRFMLIGIRLEPDCSVLHTPLKDFSVRYGDLPIRIVAIKRRQRTLIPKGDDLLIQGDQIFITCDRAQLHKALQFFGKSDTKVQDLMIIGGGLVGEFVAKELEKDMDIKIIENDEAKARQLANKLEHALVINGDGSNLDLLTFEGLPDMDEFVAVTGDDETNIITSLVALHMKLPRTITLIRKPEYIPLTPAIGMDAVISKQMISVNAVQKFIRRRQVSFFAELPGIDAEIVEFIANEKSKIVRKPLKDINFPSNAILGGVIKGGQFSEIPTGRTHIQPGDKVIVFCLPEELKNVEKLF